MPKLKLTLLIFLIDRKTRKTRKNDSLPHIIFLIWKFFILFNLTQNDPKRDPNCAYDLFIRPYPRRERARIVFLEISSAQLGFHFGLTNTGRIKISRKAIKNDIESQIQSILDIWSDFWDLWRILNSHQFPKCQYHQYHEYHEIYRQASKILEMQYEDFIDLGLGNICQPYFILIAQYRSRHH